MTRLIREIAAEAENDMRAIKGGLSASQGYPYAWPYLLAMLDLENVREMYYQDSAKSIVLYFLANAGTWRGEVAKRIKAELKELVK